MVSVTFALPAYTIAHMADPPNQHSHEFWIWSSTIKLETELADRVIEINAIMNSVLVESGAFPFQRFGCFKMSFSFKVHMYLFSP